MPEQNFRKLHKGQQIRAVEYNKVISAIDSLQQISASFPLEALQNGSGVSMRIVPTLIESQIIGTTTTGGMGTGGALINQYSWSEMVTNGYGQWLSLPGGRSGINNAYERNNGVVPVGTYVELEPTNNNNEYIFTYSGSHGCCTVPTQCCSSPTGGASGFPMVMTLTISPNGTGGCAIQGSYPMVYQPVLNVFAPLTMTGIQGPGWVMTSNNPMGGQIFATTFFCYTTAQGGSGEMVLYFTVGTGSGEAIDCVTTGSGEEVFCPTTCEMYNIIAQGNNVSFAGEVVGLTGVSNSQQTFFNLTS